MGYKFNPFSGKLDATDSPDGVFNSVEVNGDITLDDGIAGPVTTLQTITPTQNNTISLPNATGTVALVAGSSGQPVYNNAGAYAGLSTATIGTTGNITLSLNGASGVAPVAVTGTWFAGTTPQVLIQPSNVGTAGSWSPNGTGIGVNAISTFTGNLLDLQVNGSSRLSTTSAGLTFSSTGFRTNLSGGNGYEAYWGTTFKIFDTFSNDGSVRLRLDAGGIISWNSALLGVTAPDLFILRDAAGTLAQRNGTNAQTTRIYDTYTSATDYHRIAIATARATLTGVSGASVTATGLIPAGAVVMGVTSKVTTALGTGNGTTGYKIGTGADADRWGAITGTAAGTTSDNRDWTAGTIECFPSATDVIVTATGGNFDGTGVIYLSVQYMTGQAD